MANETTGLGGTARQLEDYSSRLREAHARYCETTDLKVGDMVMWKPGLRIVMDVLPYGYPAMLVETFPRTADPETVLYDPWDAIIAVLLTDGTYRQIRVDLNRFMRYEGPAPEVH